MAADAVIKAQVSNGQMPRRLAERLLRQFVQLALRQEPRSPPSPILALPAVIEAMASTGGDSWSSPMPGDGPGGLSLRDTGSPTSSMKWAERHR